MNLVEIPEKQQLFWLAALALVEVAFDNPVVAPFYLTGRVLGHLICDLLGDDKGGQGEDDSGDDQGETCMICGEPARAGLYDPLFYRPVCSKGCWRSYLESK